MNAVALGTLRSAETTNATRKRRLPALHSLVEGEEENEGARRHTTRLAISLRRPTACHAARRAAEELHGIT